MKNLKTLLFCLLAIPVISLVTTGTVHSQQTAGQLFEKALYAEDIKGDLSEAITIYQQILEQEPGNRQIAARALLHIGMCYEKLGSAQAQRAYSDLISKYSDQETEVALARERISRLEAYEAELMAKAEEHLEKGNELFKRWEYEEAIKEYENAIHCGPNTQLALNARYCIGQSWYRAGKYDEALATFTKLIEENPKSNIAPVSELMVDQVRNALEEESPGGMINDFPEKDTIVDSATGITFRKIKTFTGESDIIKSASLLNLSPNGKFLLSENMVVPMDGTTPFELIDSESAGFLPTRTKWSPDGTKAAFYSGDALCVVPVSPETGHATGTFRKIKKERLKNQSPPAWSPDGHRIVYHDGINIWAINRDGSDLQQITDDENYKFGAAWCPDGKTIAFGSQDGSMILYNISENEFTKLAETERVPHPIWSPDGKWIIDGRGREVYLFDTDNRNRYKFSPPRETGMLFSWLADINKLLFYYPSYKSDMFLKVTPSNGGPSFEPVPLLSSEYLTWWRNDSKLMAIMGVDEKGDFAFRITSLSAGRSELIRIDDIHGIKPLPASIASDFEQIVVSIGHDNGEEDLYVVPISAEEARITGTPVKFFTKERGEETYFSPDGKKMALIREGNIWIAYTNGDDPIRVTDSEEVIDNLIWTRDGKAFLFSTSSGWSLMENPGPHGKIIKILDEGKEIECSGWNIAISPDNSRIAVLTDDQIKIIPIDNKASGKVLDISNLDLKNCFELYFSYDGKHLAFNGYKEVEDKISFPNGKACIYNVPVDGGLPVKIASNDDDLKYFLSWSPDGKWIAYSSVKTVKIRPGGTIWEADFDEILEKLAK